MVYFTFLPTLFKWWYSKGIASLFDFLSAYFIHTSNYFSPIDLITNIFKPWKRIVGQQGRGLDDFFQSLADTFISRLVGFVLRFFLIIVYLGFLLLYAMFLVFSLVFWFFMPAIALISFIYIFI